MKKLSIILLLIITMNMAIISQEKLTEDQKKRQEQINSYTQTFLLERITYNGQEGYFIPIEGYKKLRITLLDYIILQEIDIIKDERITKLEKYGVMNFKLKTALGIAIAFDFGSLFLCAGVSILCYNIAIMKR